MKEYEPFPYSIRIRVFVWLAVNYFINWKENLWERLKTYKIEIERYAIEDSFLFGHLKKALDELLKLVVVTKRHFLVTILINTILNIVYPSSHYSSVNCEINSIPKFVFLFDNLFSLRFLTKCTWGKFKIFQIISLT